MSQTPIDVTTPLTVDTDPTDVDDECLDSLTGRLTGTLSIGPVSQLFLRRLVYVAITSDDEYTLQDIAAIVDDDEKFDQFRASADIDVFPDMVRRNENRKQQSRDVIATTIADVSNQ